mmetsp:Transcript_14347/g.28651  ORF Transcript_14347/g.28651 Transcript_14347/m.28651 type:complete len:515 (-) Transcript_14347:134-1678(-)|eukprot:CAMPEP_0194330520 /NCGR_PEP_ID=MMETSP0171-20130528/52277_1 /TAXON_ID=218684 /ORGANISM="Corethron pennatum, Strain L29A3" /LENGTH=514 /DNA_ID=CAMNT_0039091639 /DNA_START=45 /DNA_END=1589 /DNA_ORIENTATION=-
MTVSVRKKYGRKSSASAAVSALVFILNLLIYSRNLAVTSVASSPASSGQVPPRAMANSTGTSSPSRIDVGSTAFPESSPQKPAVDEEIFSLLGRMDCDGMPENVCDESGDAVGGTSMDKTENGISCQHPPEDLEGGGAINEHTPSNRFPVSRTLHHLFGMHRYPRYLSRFLEEDMDALEAELEDRLDLVRRQRTRELRAREWRADLSRRWTVLGGKPLPARPRTWGQLDAILDPRAAAVIPGRTRTVPLDEFLDGRQELHLEPAALEDLLDEESNGGGAYSLPAFSKDFCAELLLAVRGLAGLDARLRAEGGDVPTVGEVPALGGGTVDLDSVGLGWVSDVLFRLYLAPIARLLFGDHDLALTITGAGPAELDWRQGFVAGYSAAAPSLPSATSRSHLVAHTDDSEVTLNLCLSDDFEGGELNFWGERGLQDVGKYMTSYTPEAGRAILHPGRLMHSVSEVTAGERHVLIVWARSWKGVRDGVCPCCWMNGRGAGRRGRGKNDAGCVCGMAWRT